MFRTGFPAASVRTTVPNGVDLEACLLGTSSIVAIVKPFRRAKFDPARMQLRKSK
jgi:hypothetical protein